MQARSRKSLIDESIEYHRLITIAYYIDKALDKPTFELAHRQYQIDLENDLKEQGHDPLNVPLREGLDAGKIT